MPACPEPGAKRNLLAVVELVTVLDCGEPVVDRMRARETAALKADPRQEGVRLDHLLHRAGADLALKRELRLDTLGNQCIVAEFRKRHRRRSHLPARTGSRIGCFGRPARPHR